MRVFATFAFTLSFTLLGVVSADSHDSVKRAMHHKRNISTSLDVRDVGQLSKRFENARFSNFPDGLGACGIVNGPDDFIVALNAPQYDGGSHCFEWVTISYGGKTARAQITDMCPGCPYAGLDMSDGLYEYFSDNGGLIYGEWEFDSGDPSPSSTSSPPPPKTTSHTSSTPATSSKAKATTTSTTPTSTSQAIRTTSSTSSTTTASTTTSIAAPTVTDTSVVDAGAIAADSGNLYDFSLAVVQLGVFLGQASKAQ
ncbi:hypothetical protein BV25DRAFT_1996125 [Artomyces pyxidatus]|uniref:Uncharacterized protein n=1 Tax=Artomyces pyxidatus TaxID=48021 RepID=A0ACB8SG04_9AGAM|nr:hypothetical protein BV25DRAFT_1996125 [Artomyces pyxidatus]